MDDCSARLKETFNGALRELEQEISRIKAEKETAKGSERLRLLVTRLRAIIGTMDDLERKLSELHNPTSSLFFQL
jgi:hypothetical protein